jgi:catechol 2,3-dioxygenase-like lactoylglutathione lyase family enzyme
MPTICHFERHAGYSGVMLGMPNERFHLEFTHADTGSPCPAPTKDNLLVLCFPNPKAYMGAVRRLQEQGHTAIEAENPYWKGKSQTFEDPDGWRVVLYDGSPFGSRG